MNSIKALQFFIEHNMTVDTLIFHRILNVLKYSLPSKRVTILMQAYQYFILPYSRKLLSCELYTIVSASWQGCVEMADLDDFCSIKLKVKLGQKIRRSSQQ